MNQQGICAIAFFQLLLIFLSVEAQEVRLTSSLDSTGYVIGDWINVHISIDHPQTTLVLWSETSLADSSVLERISESKIDTIQHQGFVTENKTITFIAFDSGVVRIPSIKLAYQENEINTPISTTPLSVHIAGIRVDTTQSFRPIKPTFSFEKKNDRLWLYGIPLASLLIIAILYWRYHKKRGIRTASSEAIVDPRLPHEKALAALDQLETGKLWESNQSKQFYVQVTQIMRAYIEAGLLIPTVDHTTREIISSLKKNLKDELLHRLSRDLRMADLVKFAKAQPSVGDHLQIIETARRLVNETSSSESMINKEMAR
ncbi:MAG: hypothetical protein H0V61_00830 [Chitinophagales bacterium]|nr:hypothetical protein [Chitinophagales bacterium]